MTRRYYSFLHGKLPSYLGRRVQHSPPVQAAKAPAAAPKVEAPNGEALLQYQLQEQQYFHAKLTKTDQQSSSSVQPQPTHTIDWLCLKRRALSLLLHPSVEDCRRRVFSHFSAWPRHGCRCHLRRRERQPYPSRRPSDKARESLTGV